MCAESLSPTRLHDVAMELPFTAHCYKLCMRAVGAGVGHVVRAIERSIILYRDHAWTRNRKSPSLTTKASFHGIASR